MTLPTLIHRHPGKRAGVAAALILAIGFAPVFLRPFINDDASYALVAQKLNAGATLYRDAVDNKPPLIYWTFAWIFRCFGPTNTAAVKVVTALVVLGSALLIQMIGETLAGAAVGKTATILFAAASVCGISSDTTAPNTEIFMNACVLLALAAFTRDWPRPPSRKRMAQTGLGLGLAMLFRIQALMAVAPLVTWIWFTPFPTSQRSRLEALGIGTLGFATPLAIAAAGLATQGALHDALRWAVWENFGYVVGAATAGDYRRKTLAVLAIIGSMAPLLGASMLALRRLRATPARGPGDHPRIFVLLLLFGSLVAYQLGGRLYGHYFLQAVPFLSLLGAYGLALTTKRSLRLAVATAFSLWILAFAVVNARQLVKPMLTTDEERAQAFIRLHVQPGATALLWAGSPLIAFENQVPFATRFINNNALTGRVWGTRYNRPDATPALTSRFERQDLWAIFFDDLMDAPPIFIVDRSDSNFPVTAYPKLASFVAANYPSPTAFGTTLVYVRRGIEAQ